MHGRSGAIHQLYSAKFCAMQYDSFIETLLFINACSYNFERTFKISLYVLVIGYNGLLEVVMLRRIAICCQQDDSYV